MGLGMVWHGGEHGRGSLFSFFFLFFLNKYVVTKFRIFDGKNQEKRYFICSILASDFTRKSFVIENSDRLNLTHIKLPNLISHQLSP